MPKSERSEEHTNAIKETAEYFRYGLILGLHSVADTLTWIDTVLISEPTLDIALIEASLSGSRGPNTIVE